MKAWVDEAFAGLDQEYILVNTHKVGRQIYLSPELRQRIESLILRDYGLDEENGETS